MKTPMRSVHVLMVAGAVATAPVAPAATLTVPTDHATVQAAIDAAVKGDTIVVLPGTYVENIHFFGKDVTVKSQSGPEVTTLDGGANGPVVRFDGGESPLAVLEGFTVTNGTGELHASGVIRRGGGVFILHSSPTIRGNVIKGNSASVPIGNGNGGGVHCDGGAPTLLENEITRNQATAGAGVAVVNGAAPVLERNSLLGNSASGDGGGLRVDAAAVTATRPAA